MATSALGENHMKLNALDEYVHKVDESYSWSIHSESETDGVRTVIIDMVSQHWLTKEDIDRPEWRHWLIVTIPPKVTSDTGLLYIGGGSNENTDPQPNDTMIRVASVTNTVVAELGMIPNQPLVYVSDEFKKPRYEDDLIAYAWDKYLETTDPRWLPRGTNGQGSRSRHGYDHCIHKFRRRTIRESCNKICGCRWIKTWVDFVVNRCNG